ncbi:hypothetical protein BASA50_005558 [Batrachochytrium salamandrivorans]|uniref:DDB1- and CUL4-associated factor 12 beta-propeller domain-containing protein n=1 Tax=Batrachochytrium salamandrivorans TaxID=1357716 RepID=A0ABQ8FFN1_9FUNG|nr:hypothetical protein BASA50_005558 [Batrachochytrium salamandrivorans]
MSSSTTRHQNSSDVLWYLDSITNHSTRHYASTDASSADDIAPTMYPTHEMHHDYPRYSPQPSHLFQNQSASTTHISMTSGTGRSSEFAGYFKRFTTRRMQSWKYPPVNSKGMADTEWSDVDISERVTDDIRIEPCNVVNYLMSRELVANHRSRPHTRHRSTMDATTIDARSDSTTVRCPDCKNPRYLDMGGGLAAIHHHADAESQSQSPTAFARSTEITSLPALKSHSVSPMRSALDWVASVKPLEGSVWPLSTLAALASAATVLTTAATYPEEAKATPTNNHHHHHTAAAQSDPFSTLYSTEESSLRDSLTTLRSSGAPDSLVPTIPSLDVPRQGSSTWALHGSPLTKSSSDSIYIDTKKVHRCSTCSTQMQLGLHENLASAGDRRLTSFVTRHLPSVLTESEFLMPDTDKLFASAWLSDNEVLLGTKCNKLHVLSLDTGRRIEIPSFADCKVNGILPIQPSERTPAEFVGVRQHQQQQQQQPSANSPLTVQNCAGIHSISINPSKTLVAVGGGSPAEHVQIYTLPTFEPYALLQGHSDVVFSVAWLNDRTLMSGSRDAQLIHWSLDPSRAACTVQPYPLHSSVSIYSPSLVRKEHMGKVRDLKYDQSTQRAFTLSSDGFVKIWDASSGSYSVISSVLLYHSTETVCLALEKTHHLVAVGSQNHVSLIDPRIGSVVHMLKSCDEGWGVRSLCIDRDTLTVGGGLGRISFYDLRSQQYLPCNSFRPYALQTESSLVSSPPSPSFTRFDDHGFNNRRSLETLGRSMATPLSQSGSYTRVSASPKLNVFAHTYSQQPEHTKVDPLFLQTGQGWLDKDEIYTHHFQDINICNAVYTLAYNPNGTRLFAAGGPLQLNLRGSYAGIWQT